MRFTQPLFRLPITSLIKLYSGEAIDIQPRITPTSDPIDKK